MREMCFDWRLRGSFDVCVWVCLRKAIVKKISSVENIVSERSEAIARLKVVGDRVIRQDYTNLGDFN